MEDVEHNVSEIGTAESALLTACSLEHVASLLAASDPTVLGF
jgi:hypothetical protein